MKEMYLWDASALVRLYLKDGKGTATADEIFHSSKSANYTTKYSEAEVLTVLKRKWEKDRKITDDQYLRLVFGIHYKLEDLSICDDYLERFENMLTALDIVKKYGIDIIDAAAIVGIMNGTLSIFTGESGPFLVTADKGMVSAATANNIKVIDLNVLP